MYGVVFLVTKKNLNNVMFCRIADLSVIIPKTGNMPERCEAYLMTDNGEGADIILRTDHYNLERWNFQLEENAIYRESGYWFHRNLIDFDGMMLHSSAIEYQGRAYLFSGPCGMGKSTHTHLWETLYGTEVTFLNDDKPALRRLDGRWFAYGTPWCGKDGINQNKKAPLAGICFLRRGENDEIRRLDKKEAMQYVLWQTTSKIKDIDKMTKLLTLVDKLVREIPIFELRCTKEQSAALLSSKTMCQAAQEENL